MHWSIYVDALSKFEEVLTINPGKHQALWCLGNAYSSQAFLNPDSDVAQGLFDKAADYFERAENMVHLYGFELNVRYCS